MCRLYGVVGRQAGSLLSHSVVGCGKNKHHHIEGLENNGTLSPVQQAFVDEGAFQCGYCTSGMVLRATALLRETPHPTEDQIVAYMDGNIAAAAPILASLPQCNAPRSHHQKQVANERPRSAAG